ncbi:Ecm27 [Kluyveromyces lactis]|nr:Ecm27 [Kluyveromyces lactis]
MNSEPGLWLRLTHPLHLYDGVEKLTIPFMAGTITQLTLCFVLLGICASDHLCPNVAYLTKSGNTSKGVIASILLAWCNSSPDLFSNLISWLNSESPATLSLGEVLGSCGIILCIIQGLLFYCMKEQLDLTIVQRNSLVTDLLFALLAMTCVLWMVVANSVTWYASFIMVAIYVMYVVSKMKLHDSLQGTDDSNKDNIIIGSSRLENGFTMDGSIRPSLLETMDLNIVIQMLENANNNTETISMNTVRPNTFIGLQSGHSKKNNRPITEPNQRLDFTSITGHERAPISTAPSQTPFKPFFDDVESVAEIPETSSEPPLTYQDTITNSTLRMMNSMLYTLFPNLKNWSLKTLQSKIISVILSPIVMMLRLCVPQYSEETRFNFPIILLQAILAPIVGMLVIESLIDGSVSLWFWFIPGTLVLLFLAGILYLRFKRLLFFGTSLYSDSNSQNEINELVIKVSNSIGIINSILCISLLANVLIEIIELYQKLTGISKSLLGITLFAWGNSISDLMSNLAMSQLYHKLPIVDSQKSAVATRFLSISLSACIGGMLLNTTIGIGLSSLIAMIFRFRTSTVPVSSSINIQFLLSISIISFTIFASIFALTRHLDLIQQNVKKVGLALCSTWLVATIINIFIEVFQ